MRNTSATAKITSEYSRPPWSQKKPLAEVAQIALSMKITIAAAANRVKNPKASMSPPTASVKATKATQNAAGCQPILSKALVNPAKPIPPNQPNNFWQPCGTNVNPITTRKIG